MGVAAGPMDSPRKLAASLMPTGPAAALDTARRLDYPPPMRADAESLNEQITASVSLLRRHL